MNNAWFLPKGYPRTSKHLHKRCLELLLSFATPQGNVLDLGCGSGNALLFLDVNNIDRYVGIDHSQELITAACRAHTAPNTLFIVDDILECSLEGFAPFDAAICAACLHGFIPYEQAVIDKLSAAIKPQGYLFLSCAFDFDYLTGEHSIQERVLKGMSYQYPCPEQLRVLNDFAFNRTAILSALHDFDIVRSQRIEEPIEFETFEDFKDWHSIIHAGLSEQFDESIRERALFDYYQKLYALYCAGRYTAAYSTGLMLLKKKP